MAKSNKPIVWGLFAAGGTITAFLTPVMIFVTGLAVPLGIMGPEVLAYERIHDFVGNWFWKLVLFGIIFFSLWHAAHRFRITMHDFGVRADGVVAKLSYSLAALGTISAIFLLLRI